MQLLNAYNGTFLPPVRLVCPDFAKSALGNARVCSWKANGINCFCHVKHMNGYYCFHPVIGPPGYEAAAKTRKDCLRLPEHFSVFDLPCTADHDVQDYIN
ncbi:unnamed protein product [Bursaphelenchus okinawaensis]|uniref:Uncharacterized protein n=1 Tax=Bursaphelenchus okinawaensis TaxID=465554 RepID=A0A811JY30_9BILA|nr:unnamed protein product [Bursaphelenchus okinawaensis]CAG9086835.1 unnamed protein product [Bursaphelenchus okinawaensis]